jgi:hypothetical protein
MLEEMPESAVRCAAAGRRPPLRLLELVAMLRVIEKIREVRKQIQAVMQ